MQLDVWSTTDPMKNNFNTNISPEETPNFEKETDIMVTAGELSRWLHSLTSACGVSAPMDVIQTNWIVQKVCYLKM